MASNEAGGDPYAHGNDGLGLGPETASIKGCVLTHSNATYTICGVVLADSLTSRQLLFVRVFVHSGLKLMFVKLVVMMM